jgi:alpha-beta hydrolase superfamily lysophospholipase
MIHQTYQWFSNDGTPLFGQSWVPESKPDKAIVIIHGIGEHSGIYADWANKFVEKNIAVISFDYRGNGKSGGKRGFCFNFNDLLNDIDVITTETEKMFSGIPKIMYGHSLGGNLALNYIMRKKTIFQKAVISSPWLTLSMKISSTKMFFGQFLNYVYPDFTFRAPIHSKDLSRNPELGINHKKDSLIHNKITPRLFFETNKAGEWAMKNPQKLTSPILLMHGETDKITSCESSREFASITIKYTQLKIWKDYLHELHFDENNQQVFNFVLNWVNE